MQENFIVLVYQGDWRTRYTTAQSTSVAHAENFRGGEVSSQSCDVTNQL